MKAFIFFALSVLLISCSNSFSSDSSADTPDSVQAIQNAPEKIEESLPEIASAEVMMSRKQVPVLCYHHIRPIRMPGKADKGYEVTVEKFKQQMKILADSGYQTILPDQYYDYLTKGTALPPKPFMITYDDTDEEQFSIAKPEMDKYGFKGVYFLMTISIGRPNYMSKTQIKQLSDEGHAIESHTWDHHRVDKYSKEDWDVQITKSRKHIEDITGKPAQYFAYPFGIWNDQAVEELKERNFKMAFQLSTKRDSLNPLMTARRIIVSNDWSAKGLLRVMHSSFK